MQLTLRSPGTGRTLVVETKDAFRLERDHDVWVAHDARSAVLAHPRLYDLTLTRVR